jgi:hypothetical protein
MAKIFEQPGNSIEASRRGAGSNGHFGDAFLFPGAGKSSEFPSLSLSLAFAIAEP